MTGFRYPSRGGFAAYLEKFISAAPIELGHEAAKIDPARRRIGFANGRELEYDQLISSVPLPELIAIIPDAPSDVRAASDELACSACVLVNVGVARPDISEMHIRYFYDRDILFTRTWSALASRRDQRDLCDRLGRPAA